MAAITGGCGLLFWRRSAEPESEVEELLPCLAISRSADAMMEEVVETLKVL